MSTLYRFDPTGRYVGWIVKDQPDEFYAARTDLVSTKPMAGTATEWPYWEAGAWVLKAKVIPPTLEEAKARKWAAIKVARKTARSLPLETPYGVFDADDAGRANLVQTAQLLQTQANTLAPGEQPTVDFTLHDNSVVTLTAGQLVEVALLLGSQVQAAYSRGRAARAAIEAATTPEELDSIVF